MLTNFTFSRRESQIKYCNSKQRLCTQFFKVSILQHKSSYITLIINQQMHYIKFRIKTTKIAPTYFDPKIILKELRCSLLKSF